MRYTLCGDLQQEKKDFDPEQLFAPVAAHESIQILLSISASKNLLLEGCDITNVYRYGYIDVPIIMHQSKDSFETLAQPGQYCLLQKPLYGARQVG